MAMVIHCRNLLHTGPTAWYDFHIIDVIFIIIIADVHKIMLLNPKWQRHKMVITACETAYVISHMRDRDNVCYVASPGE